MSASLGRFLVELFAAGEALAAVERFRAREAAYHAAAAHARREGRKLVVVGDPHAGLHTRLVPAYGCGDVCVDLTGCPGCGGAGVAVDLTRDRVPGVADGSAVVFISCVLEYVSDPGAAWRECLRMAGDGARIYLVTVQGWTMTGALYPGARWVVTRLPDGGIAWAPVAGADVLRAGLVALGGGAAALGRLP